jgi:hypothetical protein
VLVFRLALEPVCPVHLLCFVISAIDEHACRVQPCDQLLLRNYQAHFLDVSSYVRHGVNACDDSFWPLFSPT